MELVDGPSLAGLLSTGGALEIEAALTIADQILDALGTAHDRGLVHRDVKPSNVLLDEGAAKLADFGIAKSIHTNDADLTTTGQVLGSPRYLSPERLAGQPATPASDVYSVGVMLFEMLAGEPPFKRDSPIATALAHSSDPVPDLVAHCPHVDPSIADLVARAMAKRPEDRFADAPAMREELARIAPRPRSAAAGAPAMVPQSMTAAVAPTLVASVPTTHDAPLASRRVGPAAAMFAAGVIAVVVVALARLLSDRSSDDLAELVAAAESTTTPVTTIALSPATSGLPAAGLSTITALIDHLADRPNAYGVKQEDLVDKLGYVLQQSGAKRAEEAQKLVVEASKWADEGELDGAIADAAVRILQADP
jgi:serine/threonine-protein kinase